MSPRRGKIFRKVSSKHSGKITRKTLIKVSRKTSIKNKGKVSRKASRKTRAGAWTHFERVLARALTSRDPAAALRAAARDRRLDAETRRRLAAADEDGVRLSALLVARLRFERLMRGSPEAEAWYDADPASFTEAFREYHTTVPPTAFFPRDEAALFSRFKADYLITRTD